MNNYLKKTLDNLGAWTIGRECYSKGERAERLRQQAANEGVCSMLLTYGTDDNQRKLACIKAEQLKVVHGGEWNVVRRRVGVRDSLPQGYVVIAHQQQEALGLAQNEYVTVYDTKAAEENRQ
jgi:hypothetical protein